MLPFNKPMSPILSNQIPIGSNFIYQIKWDGIRGITYIYPSDLKVCTKNGTDVTRKYPELQDIKKHFKGKNAILDGEIVVFDDDNKPSFKKILSRQMIKSDNKLHQYVQSTPVYYLIFDILYLDDKDLTSFNYAYRKKILEDNFINNSSAVVVDDFSDGPSLFQLMTEKNMEGIVAKKLDSPYTFGKYHNDWLKIKIKRKMLVVVGGIKFKNNTPVSLAVGTYNENHLNYVGYVSLGLKQKDLKLLHEHVDAMKSATSPFINFKNNAETQWVDPLLTCYVSYLEKSSHDHLRHPQIIGFSSESPNKANGKEVIIDYGNTSI